MQFHGQFVTAGKPGAFHQRRDEGQAAGRAREGKGADQFMAHHILLFGQARTIGGIAQRGPITGRQTADAASASSMRWRHLPGPILATSRNTFSRPKAMRSQS